MVKHEIICYRCKKVIKKGGLFNKIGTNNIGRHYCSKCSKFIMDDIFKDSAGEHCNYLMALNCKSRTDENLYELEDSDISKLVNDLVYRVGDYFDQLGYEIVDAYDTTEMIADDISEILKRTFLKKKVKSNERRDEIC